MSPGLLSLMIAEPGHCPPSHIKDRDRATGLLCSKHYMGSLSRSLFKGGGNKMIKRSAPCIVVTKQMLVHFLDLFPGNIHTRIHSYISIYNLKNQLKNQVKENRNVFCFLRAQCSETFNPPFPPICLSEHEMFLNIMSERNCHFFSLFFLFFFL